METTNFQLMVRRFVNCHYAKFAVFICDSSKISHMFGSGTAVNLAQGMKEARNMANRALEHAAGDGPLIMVVDDHCGVCDTAADVLLDAGYQVSKASSGEGALRRLERRGPPVVLVTDIDLGDGMNGFELADMVHELYPTTGVLLVSGSHERLAYETTREAFLDKPFSIDGLLAQVAALTALTNENNETSPSLIDNSH